MMSILFYSPNQSLGKLASSLESDMTWSVSPIVTAAYERKAKGLFPQPSCSEEANQKQGVSLHIFCSKQISYQPSSIISGAPFVKYSRFPERGLSLFVGIFSGLKSLRSGLALFFHLGGVALSRVRASQEVPESFRSTYISEYFTV